MAEISRQDLKVIAVIQISYILHIYNLSMVQILFIYTISLKNRI